MGSLLHPGGTQLRHLWVNGTVLGMRAPQVTRGHEELVDDLAAGKYKCFFQDLNTITTVKG